MAFFSYVLYVGDGTTAAFPVPFPYLDDSNLFFFLNSVAYTGAVTFINSGLVSLDPAPAAGVQLVIQRKTPVSTAEATFVGGPLDSQALNLNMLQTLYALQERIDLQERTIELPFGDTITDTPARIVPPVASRALKYFYWGPNGQALAVIGGGSPGEVDAATLTFATLAIAASSTIFAGAAFVIVLGQIAIGDCQLPAIYIPASSGAALGKFQSADGQWWTLAPGPNGCPEWFGAQTNLSSYDNTAALEACLAMYPTSLLMPADYWIAGNWNINTPWRTVRGVGVNALGSTQVTRIITADPAVDIIQVGPNSQPVAIGDFLQGVTLEQLTVTRSVGPNLPPTGGLVTQGVSGLRVQYALGCYFKDLWINESINNLYVKANVACYFQGLHLVRTLVASGGGTGADRYYGVLLDSSASIGLASGNGSVYFSYISSGCAGVAINALVQSFDGFTDTYWDHLESSGHASGMLLDGTTQGDSGAPTEDLHIHHAIFDGLSGYGIYINQGNAGTNVTIDQCYFAGSLYGVFVNGSFGATSITNSQFDNLSVGIYALESLGVTDTNCNFTDCATSVQWQDSNSCESTGSILSYKSGTAHGTGAVILISAARCIWRSKITGPANSVPSGAVVLTIDSVTTHACDYNLIDCSGIDPGCCTGGSANKLILGGTQITVVGITTGAPTDMTHNVAAGVMN